MSDRPHISPALHGSNQHRGHWYGCAMRNTFTGYGPSADTAYDDWALLNHRAPTVAQTVRRVVASAQPVEWPMPRK